MTERMVQVLRALEKEDGRALSCNAIAMSIGFRRGQVRGKTSHNGKVMGPALRVISSVIALEKRGYVAFARRPDGLSGTAYRITEAGREALTDVSG